MAGRDRPHMAALVVCAVFAPGISLLICGLLATCVPGAAEALPPELLLNPFAFVIATAFGLAPSLAFGWAGCAAAERRLRGRPFWMWSLAGLGAAATYVLISVALHRVPAFDLIAPWAGMLRDPEPARVTTCIIAGILASGMIAGTAYRLASREDQVGFTRP